MRDGEEVARRQISANKDGRGWGFDTDTWRQRKCVRERGSVLEREEVC